MSVCADTERVIPGIFKRGDKYGFRANIPGTGGKQIRQSGFDTQQAAYEARNAYLGSSVKPDKGTVGAWFDEYLDTLRGVRKDTTVANYEYAFAVLKPLIGKHQLQALNESHLRTAYRELVDARYSTESIKTFHNRAKAAFGVAVKETKLVRNCATNVVPPKGKPAKGQDLWTFTQLKQFAAFVATERDAALWAFWMTTGLRRGEVCGLRWGMVDLIAGTVDVRKLRTIAAGEIVETDGKTEAGERTVPLTPQVVLALKAWQLAQPPNEFVFTSKYRKPYYPGSFEKRLKSLAKRAGLPPISPHDLRHTYATRAIESGMEVKLLSTLLGHKKTETTLNLYVHPDVDTARKANDALANMMFG